MSDGHPTVVSGAVRAYPRVIALRPNRNRPEGNNRMRTILTILLVGLALALTFAAASVLEYRAVANGPKTEGPAIVDGGTARPAAAPARENNLRERLVSRDQTSVAETGNSGFINQLFGTTDRQLQRGARAQQGDQPAPRQ